MEAFRKHLAYTYKGKPIYKFTCLHCASRKRAERYKADPAANAAAVRAWRERNPEAVKKARERFREKHPELHGLARNAHKKRRERLRTECLLAYSGNDPKCACCEESTIEFLVIDHENGNGNEHRRQTGLRSDRMWAWLVKNSFPPGFRVLCHNCNFAYSAHGLCPHARAQTDAVGG